MKIEYIMKSPIIGLSSLTFAPVDLDLYTGVTVSSILVERILGSIYAGV